MMHWENVTVSSPHSFNRQLRQMLDASQVWLDQERCYHLKVPIAGLLASCTYVISCRRSLLDLDEDAGLVLQNDII